MTHPTQATVFPNLLFPPEQWSIEFRINGSTNQDFLELWTSIYLPGHEMEKLFSRNVPLINDVDANVKLFLVQIEGELTQALTNFADFHKNPF